MRWKWTIRAYYADSVAPPKKPGQLAMETVHADDSSKDLEVSIFERREDIGRIVVTRWNRP